MPRFRRTLGGLKDYLGKAVKMKKGGFRRTLVGLKAMARIAWADLLDRFQTDPRGVEGDAVA